MFKTKHINNSEMMAAASIGLKFNTKT